MTGLAAKRVADVIMAFGLLVLLSPLMLGIALWLALAQGRPILFASERMKTADSGFTLLKFRTMRTVAADSGVSGGDKAGRITGPGRILRRYRLDELPQLINILRGDISFVGPRPPLRRYVQMFPELYGRVLRVPPGVTGLATLVFHRREEALLAACTTPAETEAVYIRRCIPVKANLDLIYARERTLCWDIWLMFATVIRRLPTRRKARPSWATAKKTSK